MHANTFAARAGRWSAQHRKTAIWGWIAFVAIAFVIGGAVGIKKPADYIGPGDSGRADQLALDHFPKDESESVLIQAPKGGSRDDADVRKAVDDVDRRRLAASHASPTSSRPTPRATRARSPRTAAPSSSSFKVRGDADQTEDAIAPIVDRGRRVKARTPTSASASSAARARTRRCRSRSPTTSRRPRSCRCRSR